MAREPQRNKAERFPRRVGNVKLQDRELTVEEQAALQEERAAIAKAREFRRRKRAEARQIT